MDNKILEIINLYENIAGRKIIPKDTEPHKTYQYRYAAKFVQNMKHIDWDVAKKIAFHAIEYARNNKDKNKTIWTRGLWVLTKSNIVDIAYAAVKLHDDRLQLDLNKVIESKKFVESQISNGELLNNSVDGGFPNIVAWYLDNKISFTYLAMSEMCKIVIKNLDPIDRKMLPPRDDFIKRRTRCLIDSEYNKNIKDILRNDYLNITRKTK